MIQNIIGHILDLKEFIWIVLACSIMIAVAGMAMAKRATLSGRSVRLLGVVLKASTRQIVPVALTLTRFMFFVYLAFFISPSMIAAAVIAGVLCVGIYAFEFDLGFLLSDLLLSMLLFATAQVKDFLLSYTYTVHSDMRITVVAWLLVLFIVLFAIFALLRALVFLVSARGGAEVGKRQKRRRLGKEAG